MAASHLETSSTLDCIICSDPPKDPVICPYCSKVFCSSCIDSWIETRARPNGICTCPHCGRPVQRHNFVKLNWLEDYVKSTNDRIQELQHAKINECSEHKEHVLSIYCLTCSKTICAQCVLPMFNGKHYGHSCSPLDGAKLSLLEAFDNQTKIDQSDLNKVERCIQNKKLTIDRIQNRKMERLDELEKFQAEIRTEIEFEATKVLKKYQDEQNVLNMIKTNYEKNRAELKKTIESSNQIELFAQKESLLKQIPQRLKVPEVSQTDLPDDIIIRSFLSLPWQTGEFVVEQFSIKQRTNDPISSSSIRLDYNQYWTLTIHPNGIGRHRGIYLSVSLQLNKGTSQSIDYNIIIQLIHQHHDDSYHNHSFKSIQSVKQGQSYAFDQFYQLNHLFQNGFLNSEKNSIKFRFKLCPKSILEERKLLQWQIKSFEQDQQNRDDQTKEMKKIKSELTHLRQEHRDINRILEDQRTKIQQLENSNSELKRKRTESDHQYPDELVHREDRRSPSNPARIVVFGDKKRSRK